MFLEGLVFAPLVSCIQRLFRVLQTRFAARPCCGPGTSNIPEAICGLATFNTLDATVTFRLVVGISVSGLSLWENLEDGQRLHEVRLQPRLEAFNFHELSYRIQSCRSRTLPSKSRQTGQDFLCSHNSCKAAR